MNTKRRPTVSVLSSKNGDRPHILCSSSCGYRRLQLSWIFVVICNQFLVVGCGSRASGEAATLRLTIKHSRCSPCLRWETAPSPAFSTTSGRATSASQASGSVACGGGRLNRCPRYGQRRDSVESQVFQDDVRLQFCFSERRQLSAERFSYFCRLVALL